ncbi:hypothetical protein NFI96_001129 [Prochilodus magdalenae]|nr:hypothetical protein NFI96_001129 [Prochilodus magdalenae]
MQRLTYWCRTNNLSLNVDKTKEMVVDFRRTWCDHSPLHIDSSTVEIVKSTKFLGAHLAEDLTWTLNSNTITKKAQQCLYFLQKLRKGSSILGTPQHGHPAEGILPPRTPSVWELLYLSCCLSTAALTYLKSEGQKISILRGIRQEHAALREQNEQHHEETMAYWTEKLVGPVSMYLPPSPPLKLVRDFICSSLPATLDPMQFAYQQNRSTDNAIALTLHTALSHLDKQNTYVRMLFLDYSSAFNIIVPSRLDIKLQDLGLNSSLCSWILNFQTDRRQVVKLAGITSSSLTLSTGAPQGCVLSPLLYPLYTHDCTARHSSHVIIK